MKHFLSGRKGRENLPAKQRAELSVAVLGAVLLLCASIAGIVAGVHIAKSDWAQKEALAQLEEEKGSYNESSIVLQNTTEARAKQIGEALGARVRVTPDGSYAVLYLPENTTIADIYGNDDYKEYLDEMSIDYHASLNEETIPSIVPSAPSYEVNDSAYGQQTYLQYVGLKDTWNTTKGRQVKVAVIDTGIDTDHPDLAGRISSLSYNASDDQVVADYDLSIIEDEQGHGTAVAGVIAAELNNAEGITGIAPEASLVVIKCDADENGEFLRSSDLVFALAYAIECDVDVVNMSFGTEDNVYEKYTKLAVDSDIICVAAAGNDSTSGETYPAALPSVIGVGAFETATLELSPYSNYGDNSDLVAPGTAYTTVMGGGYDFESGTSFAAPMVTAAVALYKSTDKYCTYDDVKAYLQASSIDLGDAGEDWYYGFGALDINALVCGERYTITYDYLTEEIASTTQVAIAGHNLQTMPEPERTYEVFDGWYYDIDCMDECAYYEDQISGDMTFYAKWINEDEGTAYTYTTLQDGTIEITGYTGKRRYVTVPASIEGKPVTKLGESAFNGNTRLRSVTLPETLTVIGRYAFSGCQNLTSITIPDSVKEIQEYAFSDCVRLGSVVLTAESSLETIGGFAFSQCGRLARLELPPKVSTVEGSAFYADTAMKTISVMQGNVSLQLLDGALYDSTGQRLIYYPAGLTDAYTVNDGAAVIGRYAFAYSRSSAVTIGSGVTKIEQDAFTYSNLAGITIPANVNTLEKEMFQCCFNLKEIIFDGSSPVRTVPKSFASYCYSLQKAELPKSAATIEGYAFAHCGLTQVAFGSGLTTIGSYAFYGTNLQNVDFPAALQTIGSYAFAYNNRLEAVSFDPAGALASIGMCAFYRSGSLQAVTLPDSLASVGELAFSGTGLQSVNIPAGVKTLGDGAFAYCGALKEITSDNAAFTASENVLYTDGGATLTVYPAGLKGEFAVPSSVKAIGAYAFAGAALLGGVTLNDGLSVIGDYAFSNTSALPTVALPDSLTQIGMNAFEYSGLTGSIVIPDAVSSIGRFAFFDDYGISEIVLSENASVTRLGYGVFGHTGITSFVVPSCVTSMGQGVFEGCSALVKVTFAAGSRLQRIAAWTFQGADKLETVQFEKGSALELIEACAFENLPSLNTVTLANCASLKAIDNYAFRNCRNLTNMNLPSSVTEIGRYAFYYCARLAQIELPAAIERVGRNAFYGTSNMDVYFKGASLPWALEEGWNNGISGYYVGVTDIQTNDDWQYALLEDGTVSAVRYLGADAVVDVTTIAGKQVASVGGNAFKDNTTVTQVILPDTLTSICGYAFYGTVNLSSITIPDSVQVIDEYAFAQSGLRTVTFGAGSSLKAIYRNAFADTKNLESIALPDSLLTLGGYAFYQSGLSEVSFGASLAEIGRYAFAGSALRAAKLPETLALVDYHAFSDTASLTSVTFGTTEALRLNDYAFYNTGVTDVYIPENVYYIGEYCFAANQKLTAFTVSADSERYSASDGVLFNKEKTKLLQYPCGRTGVFDVPAEVASISFGAFERSKVTQVNFPADSQLLSIGYRSFYGCDSLTAINVPDSVLGIDFYAFGECTSLQAVTVSSESGLAGIYAGAFYNCTSLTGFSVPAGVKEIGDYAFYGCSGMTDLTQAEGAALAYVGDYAFAYAGINGFAFAKPLEYIGTFAFAHEPNNTVTELVVPDSVKEIGYGAFAEWNSLEKVTVPFVGSYVDSDNSFQYIFANQKIASITDVTVTGGTVLPNGAFEQWGSIVHIELPDSIEKIGDWPFSCCYALAEIHLPKYLAEIGRYAFYGCHKLQNIDLPEGLTEIGDGAFLQCYKLQKIDLPEGLTEIKAYVFGECWGLQGISIPESVTSIGDYAFENSGISEILLPEKIQSIGTGAFRENHLKSISVSENNPYFTAEEGVLFNKEKTVLVQYPAMREDTAYQIPDTVTEIGSSAFSGNEYLTDILWPENLQIIGNGAFASCAGLSSVTLPDTVHTLRSGVFYTCRNLQTVVVPDSVQYLGGYGLFYGCGKLKSVTLPSKIENGDESFQSCCYGCDALEEIVLPEGIPVIGDNMFDGCSSLKTITIPTSVVEVNDYAFKDCDALTDVIYAGTEADWEKIAISDRGNDALVNAYYHRRNETVTENNLIFDINLDDHTAVFRGPEQPDLMTELIIPEFVYVDGEAYTVTVIDTMETFSLYECEGIVSLYIPKSVETIKASAFNSCSKLRKVEFEDNSRLKEIEKFAFYRCKYLNEINLPDSLAVIGQQAFLGTGFEHLLIPSGVKELAYSLFSDCNNLKSIVFEDLDAQVSLDSSTFYSCSQLEYVKLPIVDYMSFVECPALKTLVLNYIDNGEFTIDFSIFPQLVILSEEPSKVENTFRYLTGENIEIYLNISEEDAENWKGAWYENNQVYFADEWDLAEFYADGDLIYGRALPRGTVLQAPAAAEAAREDEGILSYKFTGWDIDSDGQADVLPTVLTSDLTAEAVYEVTANVTPGTDASIELEEGASMQTAVSGFADTVTVTSSGEAIIVDADGVMTGVTEGNVDVTFSDGTNTAVLHVTVTPKKVSGITMGSAQMSVNVGGAKTLTYTYTPADAQDTFVWSSSDASVATVSQEGKVKGISAGTATIYVKSQKSGVSASCKVTVNARTASAPRCFSLTGGKDNIQLKWYEPFTDGGSPVTEYDIYVDDVKVASTKDTAYTLTQEGKIYVTAVNAKGESVRSSVLQGAFTSELTAKEETVTVSPGDTENTGFEDETIESGTIGEITTYSDVEEVMSDASLAERFDRADFELNEAGDCVIKAETAANAMATPNGKIHGMPANSSWVNAAENSENISMAGIITLTIAGANFGDVSRVSDITMVKMLGDVGQDGGFAYKQLAFTDNGNKLTDGCWLISEYGVDGYLKANAKISKDTLYEVTLAIVDNGPYDVNSQKGIICDPLVMIEYNVPQTKQLAGEVVLEGKAEAGSTLTAGAALQDENATYTYRWYHNGTEIEGADAATYELSQEYEGERISAAVIGYGAYSGRVISEEVLYTIPITRFKEKVVLSPESFVYDGTAKEPVVTIEGLTQGTDYTVAYSSNINAGTVAVTVTGTGNYSGSIAVDYAITARGIDTLEAEATKLSGTAYVYDGTAKEPVVTIDGLTQGTDYTVAYSSNTNAGTATVTITGTGNYSGSISREYTIAAKGIDTIDKDAVKLSETTYVYDGTEKKPVVTIDGLTQGTDYTVAYSNNTSAGTATVTITGTGNYSGSITLEFVISPAPTPILYGDIYSDNKINTKDLVRLKQYLASEKTLELPQESLLAADVFYDDRINTKDLVRLKQYLAGAGVQLGK